ncbi:proclotting enzyme [Agrilus planipennis]|uniref:Proclotting enzyme n=1 Tax=Agrilus planipennis TaxID=224129 RepID=A0A1W4WUJ4_AGRPL|nr:proclotting enzyme [Agrilus planipennis]
MNSNLLLLCCLKTIYYSLQESPSCGRPYGGPGPKIVGGYDVGYYKYPWYAALILEGEVFCGGSLITTKTVITAAHCFKPFISLVINNDSFKLEDVFIVFLGINNVCRYEDDVRKFRTQKVYIHDDYIDNIPYNDIALAVLHRDASTFTPVCLPTPNHVGGLDLKEGFVEGFGAIFYSGPDSCTLKEARVLIYSDYSCKKMIENTGNDPDYVKKAFCAGYLSGGIDTCQGDSGGPLLVVGKHGEYVLEGIVSFGFGCAEKDLLGVYTNLSEFLPWIRAKLKTENVRQENFIETTTLGDVKNMRRRRRKMKRRKRKRFQIMYYY